MLLERVFGIIIVPDASQIYALTVQELIRTKSQISFYLQTNNNQLSLLKSLPHLNLLCKLWPKLTLIENVKLKNETNSEWQNPSQPILKTKKKIKLQKMMINQVKKNSQAKNCSRKKEKRRDKLFNRLIIIRKCTKNRNTLIRISKWW